MEDNYSDLNKELSIITADLFNKKMDEIMVDFEEFNFYDGKRDFVIKAETSVNNVNLLEKWAEKIKKIFLESKLNGNDLVIGIKTYATDSCWREIELK